MRPFKCSPSYAKNLDILVALITHLGYTDWNMRSSKNLSKALGIPEDKILYVISNFPAFFRRASFVSEQGTHFYQLHVRHAIRWKEDADKEREGRDTSLEASTINSLVDTAVKCADQERRHALGYLTVFIAAAVSIGGAIFTFLIKNSSSC